MFILSLLCLFVNMGIIFFTYTDESARGAEENVTVKKY